MLDNPTPAVPANKVSDYGFFESNYVAKYSSSPINYPLKPVGLWNVSLLAVGLSSIHCIKDVLIQI